MAKRKIVRDRRGIILRKGQRVKYTSNKANIEVDGILLEDPKGLVLTDYENRPLGFIDELRELGSFIIITKPWENEKTKI